jgi:NAD(P)H-hydrate epimerase
VPEHLVETSEAEAEILTAAEVRGLLPPRPLDAHKGDFGRVLVVAGSVGMTGAAALCGEAALRIGAGLVYVATPKSLNEVLEAKVTEVITHPMPETPRRSLALDAAEPIIELAGQCDAVALGPGLSQDPETQQLVYRLVEGIDKPLLVDADGLNALRRQRGLLVGRQHATIVTPHPGEMARLMGTRASDVQADRASAARRAAKELGSIIVLKGAGTLVVEPGRDLYTVNTTGNSGMASGGTGDVLSGMIVGLLAQSVTPLSPYHAARLGVYLHGLAGDLAAVEIGQRGLVAGDLLRHVPAALRRIEEGAG